VLETSEGIVYANVDLEAYISEISNCFLCVDCTLPEKISAQVLPFLHSQPEPSYLEQLNVTCSNILCSTC
jgi:hypothetical protein